MTLGLRFSFVLWLFIYSIGAIADEKSFHCGNHVLHVKNIQKGELSEVQLDIWDADDKKVVKSVSGGGEVVSLCKVNEVLILDTNSQYAPSVSLLLSDSGKELMRKNLGVVDAFDKSNDDKVFWIQTKEAVDKAPAIQVQVFGYDGSTIDTKTFDKAGVLSVVFQGQTYKIKVIEPDYPG